MAEKLTQQHLPSPGRAGAHLVWLWFYCREKRLLARASSGSGEQRSGLSLLPAQVKGSAADMHSLRQKSGGHPSQGLGGGRANWKEEE